MAGAITTYITRLERELQRRGVDDSRILAEAREHLLDAVEDGRQRGLSADDAERDALERFGAPEIVAAHMVAERDRSMTGMSNALRMAWQRKWWILVPTVCAAIVMGVLSSYFLPTRYRAETRMLLVSPALGDFQRPIVTTSSSGYVQRIVALLSQSSLQAIIEEFDLYREERTRQPINEVVEQMRGDIRVADLGRDDLFSVSFVSSDPGTAMKVVSRLASVLIDANMQDRTAIGTLEFLESQAEHARVQLSQQEAILRLREQKSERELSQTDLIPYEVARASYTALLNKLLEARVSENLERRSGRQLRILDPARLASPVGPSRGGFGLLGALIGLAIGVALVALRGGATPRPPTLAEA